MNKYGIKDVILFGSLLLVLYLVTCGKPKTVTKTVIQHFRDTITVNTVDTFKKIIKVPVKEIEYLTTYIDLSDTTVFGIQLQTFHYGEKDSLLEYNVYITSEIKPQRVKFDYNLTQFDIKTNTTTTIKDSVYSNELKSYMSFGAIISGNKYNAGFAPVIQYNHKKGSNFLIGYDVIDKTFQVGFTKKVSLRE